MKQSLDEALENVINLEGAIKEVQAKIAIHLPNKDLSKMSDTFKSFFQGCYDGWINSYYRIAIHFNPVLDFNDVKRCIVHTLENSTDVKLLSDLNGLINRAFEISNLLKQNRKRVDAAINRLQEQ